MWKTMQKHACFKQPREGLQTGVPPFPLDWHDVIKCAPVQEARIDPSFIWKRELAECGHVEMGMLLSFVDAEKFAVHVLTQETNFLITAI